MPTITRQFTKFIFPFQFEEGRLNPAQVKMATKKGEAEVFERFSVATESLREGLDMMLSSEGGTAKVADCYRLNVNCRRHFSLPPRKTDALDFYTRAGGDTPQRVAITDLKLYLFESRVGYAELECEYESRSLEDYVDLNYFISEAKSEKNRFISHEKVWNEETRTATVKDTAFTVGELLSCLFDEISGGDSTAVQFSYQKVKPLVYSYLLVDEKPDDIKDLLFHLNKNYKDSYKFAADCTAVNTLHPFDNSYWTSSLNGATNLSFLTGDKITDGFFTDDFYTKAKDTYYFLFLNVLHQRHAIARITGEMGHLDCLVNDYYLMSEQLKQAKTCEARAINLKFRAFFKYPSSIEHINNYYDMLYKSFQINEFYTNFTQDITNLQNICKRYVDRITERENKIKKCKAAKTEILVSIAGTVVAEVTVFNNSWALIEKILGHSVDFWSPTILILLAALISPLFTIFMNVKKQLYEINTLTEQLKTERYENLVEDDRDRRKKRKKFRKKLKRLFKSKHEGKK